jgi:hypothetical protein
MLHSSTISCQLMQLLFYSHIHFSKYITYKQATSKNTSSKDHAYRIRPLAIIVVAFVGCILQNGIFHKEKDAIYQLPNIQISTKPKCDTQGERNVKFSQELPIGTVHDRFDMVHDHCPWVWDCA